MKEEIFIKGYLIKPVFEILKKKYDLKSPNTNHFFVSSSNGQYKVEYKSTRLNLDFSDDEYIQDLILEIKNNPYYERMCLS